jgi:hypothetical protein
MQKAISRRYSPGDWIENEILSWTKVDKVKQTSLDIFETLHRLDPHGTGLRDSSEDIVGRLHDSPLTLVFGYADRDCNSAARGR